MICWLTWVYVAPASDIPFILTTCGGANRSLFGLSGFFVSEFKEYRIAVLAGFQKTRKRELFWPKWPHFWPKDRQNTGFAVTDSGNNILGSSTTYRGGAK
jgi:hypothetical protein